MRPVLVTGFGSFRNVEDNPSGWLARRLDGTSVGGHPVVCVELPVTYEAVRARVPALLHTHRPAVAIATGVGRPGGARLETVARNAVRSTEADVAGEAPVGTLLVPGGPVTHACRWDAAALAAALDRPHLRVEASEDAGGYVCDAAFYLLVHHLPEDATGGFLHVPPTDPPEERERLARLVASLAALALNSGVGVGTG